MGGHYYDYQGGTCHTISDGEGQKPTSPKGAWRRGWTPSVTTVTHEFPSQFLMTWKAKEVAKVASVNPQMPGEADEDYIEKVLSIHHRQQARIMDFGTRVHADCESVVALVEAGMELDQVNFDGDTAEHAKAFYHWYVDNRESLRGSISDIKTQAEPFNTYPEYKMQLAAYADAILDDSPLESLSQPVTEKVVVNRSLGYGGTVDFYWPNHWDSIDDIQLINIFISRETPVVIKAQRYRKSLNKELVMDWLATLRHYQRRHGDVTRSPQWPENREIEPRTPKFKEVVA